MTNTPKLTRRALVIGAGAMGVMGAGLARAQAPASAPNPITANPAAAPGLATAKTRVIMNDASGLNPTAMARHWLVEDKDAARIEALRKALKEAASEKRSVVVGAARHSMGGQALARDGLAITFRDAEIEPDTAKNLYRTPAGMRWRDIIGALDKIGYSPAVMQSNADFGVGATFCVNAHGWPVPYGPFGSTVRAMRLMLANGEIVECSREREPELFRLAMGGYGLFGIIIDLDVEMTRNLLLRRTTALVQPEEFGARFVNAIKSDPNVKMAYGRLNVERGAFFSKALLVTYAPEKNAPAQLPAVTDHSLMTGLSREIYRAQVGSELGKRARWLAEATLDPKIAASTATRNSLMAEPVVNLANTDVTRTDILHEYFVPPARFADFVKACRAIIPPAKAEFLNVTLRYVAPDSDAVLAFAPQERIAAVMSFSQKTSPAGEIDMMQMTEKLIDAVVNLGGAFYLPYRLHARKDQVIASYPKAPYFAEKKRFYDPGLLFRNAMWEAYFA
jgi:FAD/FMN-containing dehydrogenase